MQASSAISFFRIDGVAANDFLNIRSKPDSESIPDGVIPAAAAHIEGVGTPETIGHTTWQRVHYGGVVGWVNARFLKVEAGGAPPQPPPNKIEAISPLVCFGTEPHWAFRFGADGTATHVTSGVDGPPTSLRATKIVTARQGTLDAFDLLDLQGKQWLSVVVAKTGKCSDGMSDTPYPFEFDGTGKPGHLTGCRRVKAKDALRTAAARCAAQRRRWRL